nr:cytochrome P450 [Tanacetum cinerariifolium]
LVEEGDTPQLNYIKACIKEAFRLHPFAPFNPPHVSIKNTTVAGYFILKGSHVHLSRHGLGRNPSTWKDPLRFNPYRHLVKEGKHVVLSDDELKMISFSTGKRGCPAVSLGSTITTMLLTRMIQGFSWGIPGNQSSIELAESNNDLSLAKPLVAVAKPRLPRHLCLEIKYDIRLTLSVGFGSWVVLGDGWIRSISGVDTTYLFIYVDDIVLTTSTTLLQKMICSLHWEFDMTGLSALNYFLRISVTRDTKGMFLSQKKYVMELLERAHMLNYNPTQTPANIKSKLGP